MEKDKVIRKSHELRTDGKLKSGRYEKKGRFAGPTSIDRNSMAGVTPRHKKNKRTSKANSRKRNLP
jgi:hypothetical protein